MIEGEVKEIGEKKAIKVSLKKTLKATGYLKKNSSWYYPLMSKTG
jgi:hypothetical protein